EETKIKSAIAKNWPGEERKKILVLLLLLLLAQLHHLHPCHCPKTTSPPLTSATADALAVHTPPAAVLHDPFGSAAPPLFAAWRL
ncbi:hypothetical protein BJ742DRAFT_792877, partial [Cladochytrium replicatum]